MNVQKEGRSVYDVPPFPTNMGELAPSKLTIPVFFVVQPVMVKYCKEYVFIERIGICIK
jgi:hypothetical protein